LGAAGAVFATESVCPLNGYPAGTIPVVSSESYLLISTKAAKDLGVTVPETLLVEAEKVIR
jgi:ABC-type uncharacterized transport system substrate-binding protein